MKVITNISQLDLNKQYTYADYLTWQFSERVELIKGWVYKMSPAPKRRHQAVQMALSNLLYNSLVEKCSIYTAPFDVLLNSDGKSTIVQPDISIICDKTKLTEQGCTGAPDLVIEILSLSTSKKDYGVKYDLYAENGVKEYWIVNPELNSVEVYVLENSNYTLYKEFIATQTMLYAYGKLFPNLKLKMEDIFKE